MFWRSLTYFLLETGSVIIHGDGHKGTDFSHPNFSCIQNHYKSMKVSLMLFPNKRKCHGDTARSERGDDSHNSVRNVSWSTKKLRPNSWEALNYTRNMAKIVCCFIKYLKYLKLPKTKKKQEWNKFAKVIFLKAGRQQKPRSARSVFF